MRSLQHMNETNTLILIASVVAAVGIGVAIFFLLRFLRGTIKLQLPVTGYRAGDEIIGSFELHTKKAIQGNRLIVSLIGVEQRRHQRNGKTETDSHEIFRKEELIEEARLYPAGTRQRYDFALKIPQPSELEAKIRDLAKGIQMVASLLSANRQKVVWRVEARLDAKGIDLVGSQKVTVSD